MGILHGLESRLRGAVDGTFARIFGGSVQPAEVTAALQHEAAVRATDEHGRRVVPNRYTVELGPTDAADAGDDLRRASSAFSAMLRDYVVDQGWETYADVVVTLQESNRLHTGQFRVRSMIDPGVGGAGVASRYDDPHAYPPAAPYRPGEPGSPRYRQPSVPREQFPPEQFPPSQYPHEQFPPGPYPREQYPSERYPHQPLADYPAYRDPRPAAGYDPRPQPRLIVEDGTGRTHPLRRGSNVVGRGQSAALRLGDSAVSREHIDVYFDGRVAIVHDLGSTNGTSVNGQPVQTWQLTDGDVIRLGQSTVVYSAR